MEIMWHDNHITIMSRKICATRSGSLTEVTPQVEQTDRQTDERGGGVGLRRGRELRGTDSKTSNNILRGARVIRAAATAGRGHNVDFCPAKQIH